MHALTAAVLLGLAASLPLAAHAFAERGAQRIYGVPDLRGLAAGIGADGYPHAAAPLDNAYLQGDFLITSVDSSYITVHPLGPFAPVKEPEKIQKLAAAGRLLLGETVLRIESDSASRSYQSGRLLHVPASAPLKLLKVELTPRPNAFVAHPDGAVVAEARFPGAPAERAEVIPVVATEDPSPPRYAPSTSDKVLVADKRTGARVWRPYDGKLEWDGASDGGRLATGPGTLRIYDKKGKVAAVLTGRMQGGRLAGQVTAVYPISPDRQSYRGEFANWSENGRGTMTFRNGQVVEGLWRDGELMQREESAPAAGGDARPVSFGPAKIGDWDNERVLSDLANAATNAGRELEAVYQELRDRLPVEPKKQLVTAERAWVAYQDQILKLAPTQWPKRPDFEMRKLQLDHSLSYQRMVELRALLGVLKNPGADLEGVESGRHAKDALSDAIKAVAERGRYPHAAIEKIVTGSTTANAAGAVLGALRLSASQQEAVISASGAMSASHTADILQFWFAGDFEKEPVPAVITIKVEREKWVATAKALQAEIAAAWKVTDGKLPAPLSEATAAKLKGWLASEPPTAEQAEMGSPETLRLAGQVNDALRETPPDMAALLRLTTGQAARQMNAGWAKALADVAAARQAKALALQREAAERLQKRDFDAAAQRLAAAREEFPSPSLAAYSRALDAYSALASDKALRAVDSDWHTPTLPDKRATAEAMDALRGLPRTPGGEIAPELGELAIGLEAASLLQAFASNYEPSGNRDRPHPVRALQALREAERYKQLTATPVLLAEPFLERLKGLEELIGPKIAEFQKLLGDAQALEKEGKFLKAAAAYHSAQAIETSRELEQSIGRCESKVSGL